MVTVLFVRTLHSHRSISTAVKQSGLPPIYPYTGIPLLQKGLRSPLKPVEAPQFQYKPLFEAEASDVASYQPHERGNAKLQEMSIHVKPILHRKLSCIVIERAVVVQEHLGASVLTLNPNGSLTLPLS
jgi:hypothetical protein